VQWRREIALRRAPSIRNLVMDEERMWPKPLVEVIALFFPVVLRHCSLGDRKSVGPIKILCHLSPGFCSRADGGGKPSRMANT